MKKRDIKDMDANVLKDSESKIREELMRLRLKKGFEQLENPKRIKVLKRNLARILTKAKLLEKGL
ncbi:MAG: 50S ribosomal protein L29 [Desulfurella sp.]|uniref:50S ribosomal protein L29 n=1 Tax=Desulfurella sp. TaxID=1962857 RepID=UPI003C7EF848